MTPDEKSGVISCPDHRCAWVALAAMLKTEPTVGNAVLGVPAAEGGNRPHSAGTTLAHRTRWNAGDGVPYAQPSRPQEPPLRGFWEIKRGRKNPTQHRYHITNPFSSQRPNGPPGAKSVFSTKANVCIWETFRLEKFGFSCYLIVTKRNRKNTESSGGLPKANGKYGNQSDFKSK